MAGAPANILETGQLQIRVRTNRPGAKLHQEGGRSQPFVFDAARRALFERRVSKVQKGGHGFLGFRTAC